jgi:hypothetical protein
MLESVENFLHASTRQPWHRGECNFYFHFAFEVITQVVSVNHTTELTKADNNLRHERKYNQLPPLSIEKETSVNTFPFLSNTHFVPTGRNNFAHARRQNKMSAADIRYLVQL